MELEISLKRWKEWSGQLEDMKNRIFGWEKELEELCQTIQKESDREEMRILLQNLQKEKEFLQKQRLHFWNMKIALEKISRLYADCEEAVIDEGESGKKQFAEEFRVMDMEIFHFINFKLLGEENWDD